MKLEFIEINTPRCKEMYIRHITELVHIPVLENDTWNNLFDKVLSFRDKEEYKSAAKEWVELNRDRPDPEVLDQKIFSESLGGTLAYAIFNLKRI
ncbi:hypothetical protein [Bacteroides sp.]|uniref:hypothetical protein n=1 Tax=Bacteroides sp. TaxID=29523 RepID=UPI002631D1BA|nr:hypothetical protein [Bacteroides sp.]MDD3038850.1 hypothetical protein [Bacteroides sp.]